MVWVMQKSLVSALRRAQIDPTQQVPHGAGMLAVLLLWRHGCHLWGHGQSLSRKKRMDRLCCASAIFQMTVTNAIIGSMLKEAPRLRNVTGTLEFKEKELVLSFVCLFHSSYCKIPHQLWRLGCNLWLKLHNSEVT